MKKLKIVIKNNIQFVKDFFTKGHKRTLKAKKNIAASFSIKGLSIIVSLLLVPLTIDYVNPTQYGIWLTLSSIIAWFSFFDIGFANGLRNRFAEAIANQNFEKARIYVSTTYAILVLIFTVILVLFFGINFFVDWSVILNTTPNMATELSTVALIVFSFFCIQMVLKTISTILLADQKPAMSAFLDTLGQLISLIIIFILTKTTNGSLINLGFAFGLAPIVVLGISSIWFFRKVYRIYSPSVKYVNFTYTKYIMKLGIKFFIIQIAVIVIYQSSNIIISHVSGPVDVTVFNIAYKYIGILLMAFAILTSPYWSAFTEAYVEKDYSWMISTVKKLRKINYLLVIAVIVILIISNPVYKLWIGDAVIIPFSVSASISLFVIILSLITLNTHILNGFGKIKLQLITYSIGTILHVPTAILLGKKLGIIGVVFSASFYCLIIGIFSVIQVNKLIQRKASGIWNE